MKNVLRGKKISNSHSTYIPLAGEVIKFIKDDERIKKIALGAIKRVSPGKRRIKVLDSGVHSKITVRDVNAVQTLFVMGIGPGDLQALLSELEY